MTRAEIRFAANRMMYDRYTSVTLATTAVRYSCLAAAALFPMERLRRAGGNYPLNSELSSFGHSSLPFSSEYSNETRDRLRPAVPIDQ